MSYLVHLQQFEGPLALLLYLIRKEEMDILDINVNDITRQYLDHIRMMKELDLEVAGEFVAMAATLIHIKSKMLLPNYDEKGEVVEASEDPRKELVQKLLDYQRYQDGAKRLYERPLLNRDLFLRGVREDFGNGDAGEVILEDEGLFSLIASYRRVVRKALRAVHKVRPKVQSIASRLMEISHRLMVGSRVTLRDLISHPTGEARRTQLLITFLSMLELGRMGFVSIFQNEIYGDIYIDALKPIEQNVLERVQEFETLDADQAANAMINEALEEKIDMQEAMMSEDGPQMALGHQSGGSQVLSEAEMANEEFALPDLGDLSSLSLDESISRSLADSRGDSIDDEGEINSEMASDEELLAAEQELAHVSDDALKATSEEDLAKFLDEELGRPAHDEELDLV